MNDRAMNDLDQQLRDAGARLRATAPSAEATEEALDGVGDLRIVQHPNRRRASVVALALVAAAAAVVGVVVLTRPSGDPVVSTDSTGVTTAPSPSGPTVTSPATEPSTPTSSPSTPATSPTTPATEPTTPPAGAPWTPEPPPEFGLVACCGANATGPASPEFTAEGQPLADGLYWADVSEWSAADPTRLAVTVRRLVPCADGVAQCSPQGDGTYGADEVGVSDEERALDVTLDPSVAVELAGIDPAQVTPDSMGGVNRRSDGAALVTLLSALADSYDELVGAPVAAGASPESVVADLRANPRGGFSAAPDQLGQLYFTNGDAPSVLFQTVSLLDVDNFPQPLPRSGTSAVDLTALEVRDGALTLYFYAGFIS
jgi:hypothetical protein